MTTRVNFFFHRGLVAIPVLTKSQDTKDSVFVLEQPYLGTAQHIDASGTPQFTLAAPEKTSCVRIEVADAATVRLEFLPPGRTGIADSGASPRLSGTDLYHCGPGWTISVVEAV